MLKPVQGIDIGKSACDDDIHMGALPHHHGVVLLTRTVTSPWASVPPVMELTAYFSRLLLVFGDFCDCLESRINRAVAESGVFHYLARTSISTVAVGMATVPLTTFSSMSL